MSDPLHTKVKKGFLAFIQGVELSELAGYNYVRGIRAGLLSLPCVAVAVTNREPDFEEDESPVWKLTVSICLRTRADFTSAHIAEAAEDAHDAAAAALEAALTKSAVREFVNSENESNRPVVNFHLYDFKQPSVESVYDQKAQVFNTVLTFTDVLVQNDDCDA